MMNTRLSIRTRLALWYFLFFAVAQIAFGLAACELLRHSLNSAVRETLSDTVEDVRRFLISQNPMDSDARLRDEVKEEYSAERDGDWLQIGDPQGGWLYRSPLMQKAGVTSPVNRGMRLQHLSINGKPFSFVFQIVNVRGVAYPVQAGMDISQLRATVVRFEIGLVVLAPLVFLLAAWGGYWLSGRALAPVDAITQAARSISAHNLGQRLAPIDTGDELQRLSETLNDMLARIDSGFQRVREFTADASHELRTPLTLIRTEAELALRKPRSQADYESALRNVLAECNRTAALVDGLLALARADAGIDDLQKSPVVIAPLLRDVAANWHGAISDRRLHLGTSFVDESLAVSADPTALRRVFGILLENAAKYTPAPGTIEISAHGLGSRAIIAFRDSGIGIGEEDLPNIFERFYRADKARTREQGGVGLGLSIARAIVRKHQGELRVVSKPGAGSTFSVVLPLVEASANKDQNVPAEATVF